VSQEPPSFTDEHQHHSNDRISEVTSTGPTIRRTMTSTATNKTCNRCNSHNMQPSALCNPGATTCTQVADTNIKTDKHVARIAHFMTGRGGARVILRSTVPWHGQSSDPRSPVPRMDVPPRTTFTTIVVRERHRPVIWALNSGKPPSILFPQPLSLSSLSIPFSHLTTATKAATMHHPTQRAVIAVLCNGRHTTRFAESPTTSSTTSSVQLQRKGRAPRCGWRVCWLSATLRSNIGPWTADCTPQIQTPSTGWCRTPSMPTIGRWQYASSSSVKHPLASTACTHPHHQSRPSSPT
jgi:hypothetical protein